MYLFFTTYRGCQEKIADSKADIEAARLLTLSCAAAIDENGAKGARDQIALIKVAVPNLAFRVIDRAIQVRAAISQSEIFIIITNLTFFLFLHKKNRFMEVQAYMVISRWRERLQV